MAKINLKLDTRRAKDNGKFPIIFQLSHNSKSTTISTGIDIPAEYWCGEMGKTVHSKCPNAKRINAELEELLYLYSAKLRSLTTTGEIDKLSLTETKKRILDRGDSKSQQTFTTFFQDFTNRKDRPRTKTIYDQTRIKIDKFAEHVMHTGDWEFEDITLSWLRQFEDFLKSQGLKTNSIGIHLRNIRTVINAAIDDELTDIYPFRKFKIKREETMKRSLSVDELRILMNYKCEPHQERYRDIFMFIFYLVGINTVDLFNLTDIHNERIEYRRSKTGRLFSIKVEPEAQAIIDKYRGDKHLLNAADDYSDYRNFVHRMNQALQQIGPATRSGLGGKKYRNPLFPKLSTYWARHTWATLAAEIDIPDDTIALALGHSSGNRVTSIYIRRNLRKVDDANRAVIDYLLGM